MSDHWILCVDDDERVLSGLDLQLGFDFDVRTAVGGAQALELLAEDDDCAVIISDMRMPEMNGAQFLKASRKISPDSTRILLTGFSDIDDAMSAVNDGGIFRFLTKPSPPEIVVGAVEDGVRLWDLIRSERVLLEQTLQGAVAALVEALELAAPTVFPGIRRIEAASRHVALNLGISPIWQVGLAGLLYRLGWIAVPTEIVEKHLGGYMLSGTEADMFAATSETTVRLISHIPRLEPVAEIITSMSMPTRNVDAAAIVSAAAEMIRQMGMGLSGSQAVATLKGQFATQIVDSLQTWDGATTTATRRELTVHQIAEGMIILEDVRSEGGSLLVKSGTLATPVVIDRLRNFAETQGVREPIIVTFG